MVLRDPQRNITGTAADVERVRKCTQSSWFAQTIGESTEAAIGALPFLRPGAADATGPFAGIGHALTI